MKKWIGIGLVVALGLGLAFWMGGGKTSGDSEKKEPEMASSKKEGRKGNRDRKPPTSFDERFDVDDDPIGNVRIEGQVIDGTSDPVAGASVIINSNPPKIAMTEKDGSFFFDKLVSRTYNLRARSSEGVAGPVTTQVNEQTEPIILKLVEGSTVDVVVNKKGKALANADVELRGVDVVSKQTDGNGKVSFRPVNIGRYEIKAKADRMAPAFQSFRVSQSQSKQEFVLELKDGASVKGRVLGPDGKAVSGAKVMYSGASEWGLRADPKLDRVLSDQNGSFEFDALPAGSFRFVASHETMAKGSSELVELDGLTPMEGIEVRLQDGAVLKGKVIDREGKGVSGARVRLMTARDGNWRRRPRESFTDDSGKYEMTGLSQEQFRVLAVHESATSETEQVDLSQKPHSIELNLNLSIVGEIAGVVVDKNGEPVEGAQLSLFPDFRRNKGITEDFRLRGVGQMISDAGGQFSFKGLEDIHYSVRARPPGSVTRGRRGGRDGTKANVGDLNLRIELPKDGGVKGKVLFDNGEAPKQYSINVGGWGKGTSFSNKEGNFEIGDMPPKEYSLIVSGLGFTQIEKKIEIEEGKMKDVGTLTVTKGRSISGVVQDSGGSPLPGAKVLAGKMIVGDGSSTGNSTRRGPPLSRLTKEATTGDDGSFLISGMAPGDVSIVAEHSELGRSKGMRVTGTNDSIENLVLKIEKFGKLTGRVSRGSEPVPELFVSAASLTAPGITSNVQTGEDGMFSFDKLAPDVYKVTTTSGNPMIGMNSKSVEVTLQADGRENVTIELLASDIKLEVKIQDREGGNAAFTWVTGTQGSVVARNGRELTAKVGAMSEGTGFQGMSIRGFKDATFEGVVAGQYTLCAVPYPKEVKGEVDTISYMERMGEELKVFCEPLTVEEGNNNQVASLTVDVPDFVPAQ